MHFFQTTNHHLLEPKPTESLTEDQKALILSNSEDKLNESSKTDEENPRLRSFAFLGLRSDFMKEFLTDIPLSECSSPQLEAQEAFLIKNIDTGESYDLRNLKTLEEINSKFRLLDENNKNTAWKSYWKEVNHRIEQLWDAAEMGDLAKLKSILLINENAYTLDINVKGLDKWTALHHACNEGHTALVEFLLSQGADIESKTKMERRSLHIAAIRGHIEVVGILIKNGCQLEPEDEDLYTPLHYASEHGFDDIVRELLNHDVRIDLKNYQGMTAMDLSQDYCIMEIFKEYNKEVNFGRTSYGNCIRTTSRADYVNKLLFTGNRIKIKEIFNENKKFIKVIINKMGPNAFDFYKLLGKGSFGEVYLVRKRGSSQNYAMKVLFKDKIANKNLMKYVTSERNILSTLNHPFLIKLHCAFQTIDKFFLVMEYCPGGDLEKQLILRKRFTEEETRFYLAEIVLALESLHKGHIIYRDLKPANILIDDYGHIKLTDFGLSKQGIENNFTNSFCGSLAYLAPEILLKHGHNRTVDWYLLGMLMFELLVGTPPYYSSNRQELFDNIINGPLFLPKYLSVEAEDLIKQLLCRTPANRLGANSDAEEIKGHIWFKGLDWDKVYRKELNPPFSFNLKKNEIGSSLQKYLKKEDESLEEIEKIDNWTIIPDEESQSP